MVLNKYILYYPGTNTRVFVTTHIKQKILILTILTPQVLKAKWRRGREGNHVEAKL